MSPSLYSRSIILHYHSQDKHPYLAVTLSILHINNKIQAKPWYHFLRVIREYYKYYSSCLFQTVCSAASTSCTSYEGEDSNSHSSCCIVSFSCCYEYFRMFIDTSRYSISTFYLGLYHLALQDILQWRKEYKPLKIYVYGLMFTVWSFLLNSCRYAIPPKYNKELLRNYANWRSKSILLTSHTALNSFFNSRLFSDSYNTLIIHRHVC